MTLQPRKLATVLLTGALITSTTALVRADADGLLDQAIEENRGAEPRTTATNDPLAQAEQLIANGELTRAVQILEAAHAAAPRDQLIHLHLLRAKQAAGKLSLTEREALNLLEEQQRAAAAQVIREVRLNILQAGQAITAGRHALANQLITESEQLLDQLPVDIDAEAHWKTLAGLRRSVAAHISAATATTGVDQRQMKDVFDRNPLLLTETGETSDDTEAANGDAVTTPAPEPGTLIDVDAALEPMEQRLTYERDVYQATMAARANTLLTASEAALPASPDGAMTFPADWAQRSARRAKYRGGMIYRTPEFTGADGQTYYTAIYDLGDLVHPVPNFFADYPGTQRRTRIEDDDRFYLQTRSQFFNGFADDLAAALPLMHFFGGIDNNAVTANVDPQETERVVRIIDQFLHNAQPMRPN